MIRFYLFDYPKLVWKWFSQNKTVWFFTVFFAVCLLAPIFRGWHQRDFRIVSTALQLVGVWQVLQGIGDTRRLFGKENVQQALFQGFKNALRQFPRPWRKSVTIYAGIGMASASATGGGVATLILGNDSNSSIEARISRIEHGIETLGHQLHEAKVAMQQGDAKLAQQIVSVKQDTEKELQTINEKLILTHTGGLSISLIGVISIFLGLMYAVLPDIMFYCRVTLPE